MRPEDLDAFFHEGWNRHDVDTLMTFMADDCVFESAGGLEACGTPHAGRQQVREAFTRIFATFPDVTFRDVSHVVSGDRGLSEWTFAGTTREGRAVEVNGCDLFTFRGDKIVLKSSYLKNRSA